MVEYTRKRENLFFAGQITGTEGYTESIASGMLAGINMANYIEGKSLLILPKETMLGALTQYITDENKDNTVSECSYDIVGGD